MPHPDTIRLVLVIIALVFFGVGVIRPFYGAISYLIIMMIRPGLYYPSLGALRIELIVGVAIIIRMALSPDALSRIWDLSNPVIKWMFALFAVMGISMAQAIDFKHSLDWMFDFSKIFLFFLMIVGLIDDKRDLKMFLWAFGIVTCLIAYDAIYNYHAGVLVKSTEGSERVDYAVASDGMGSGHVALASLILQCMPFLWYLGACGEDRALKGFGFLLFLVCFYGVVISGSRGGFVGLLTLGGCLVLFSKNRIVMLVIVAACVFAIPIVSQTGYMDYIRTIIGGTDLSASSRWTGLRHGLEMLIKKPILGVGPGCYPLARKEWFGWGLWAHNHYGELLGDLGMVGTVVWFVFFKSYFIKAWQHVRQPLCDPMIKNVCLAVVVSSIVKLVLGMGAHSVYVFYWYMTAGLMAVVTRTVSNIESKSDPGDVARQE